MRKSPIRKHVQVERSRHGRTVVYFRRGRGLRFRLPDMNDPSFEEAYRAAQAGTLLRIEKDMAKIGEARRNKTRKALVGAIRAARTRSRKKGVVCDLTLEYLSEMAAAQDYRCALTGIEFFATSKAKSRVSPYIPSIDRIEPKLGYVQGNVRLTVFAVNAMLLDWGEGVFRQVARSYNYWRYAHTLGPSPIQLPSPTKIERNINDLFSAET